MFNIYWQKPNINFADVPNKIIIYRPGVQKLQTGTVSFPDQEKLLEKVLGDSYKR